MILDGRRVAQKVLGEVQAGVERLRAEVGVTPMLAVVLVGDFAPSKIYVANKKKAAEAVGVATRDRSEERRVGKSVDLGGRRIIKKKKQQFNKLLWCIE